MNSIIKKAKKRIEQRDMQKQIENLIDGVFLGTLGKMSFSSNNALCKHTPYEAATKFIDVLQKEIESLGGISRDDFANGNLGETAISTLTKLNHGSPVKVGKFKYMIDVNFTEDLHRDSLDSKYEGIDNIAALLNNGYEARGTVYGIWIGHHNNQIISGIQIRDGAKFIESAIRNFMSNYAMDYGVIDIQVNDIYK